MKKILIITRDFPPYESRGNVMRMLKFSKYLPEFGWQPYIICKKKEQIQDNTLLQQLSPLVKIFYIEIDTPLERKNRYKQLLNSNNKLHLNKKLFYLFYRYIFYNFYSFYRYNLMAPDFDIKWAKKSYDVALDLVNQDKIDAILSSGPPFSAFIPAILLNKAVNIPIVLDFRDAWVGNLVLSKNNTFLINWRNRQIEKRMIGRADHLIFATKPIQEIYHNRYPKHKDRMLTITNGFDSEDLKNLKKRKKNNDILHLIYSGTISGLQDPTSLFNGIINAIDTDKQLKKYLRISFLGKFKYKQIEILNRLNSIIYIEGELPHRDAIERMAVADVLILLINPYCGHTMMTTKIFEYIALSKPIFAVSIQCSATDLINELNVGYIADYSDELEIKNQIKNIFNDWKENRLKTPDSKKDLSIYDRKNLTKSLAIVLNKIINI